MGEVELLKVAFVGVKRKYQEMEPEYRDFFNRFHLEMPFYYARDGKLDVTITTVDYNDDTIYFEHGGSLRCLKEDEYKVDEDYDLVVHWRKWVPELYRSGAVNVIMSQDHSFTNEWKDSARVAYGDGELYGIMCFPTWHKRNLLNELGGWMNPDRAIDGLHLGVDPDVYRPSDDKSPYEMLWASDPGRGLHNAIAVATQLHSFDRRFRLHVSYPDYCRKPDVPKHPALIDHGFVKNGPDLWRLFNSCGVMPYTSTFPEPSSRSHRQAMAAGSLVLYPPNMGTPSFLLQHMKTGVVSDYNEWPRTILRLVSSGEWSKIGKNAREYAKSESWAVQASRFVAYFEKVIEENRNGH